MITLSNFSEALVSHLFVNMALIASLGVVIFAVYHRWIRTLMRGGDTIVVSQSGRQPSWLPATRPGTAGKGHRAGGGMDFGCWRLFHPMGQLGDGGG